MAQINFGFFDFRQESNLIYKYTLNNRLQKEFLLSVRNP